MSHNPAIINRAIADVTTANAGSAFVQAPHPIPVERALYQLLRAYGIDVDTLEPVSGDDLAMVYATSRKSVERGGAVADRIAKKYTYNPLLGSVPPEPKPLPAPTPPGPESPFRAPRMPAPAPAPPMDMSQFVKRPELQEAVGEVLGKLHDIETGWATNVREFTEKELRSTMSQLIAMVPQLVADAVTELQPVSLVVTTPGKEPVQLGTVHYKTGAIIAALSAGVNIYLHGPAGSGKTTCAQKAAQAFGLQFYFAAKVESEYLLLGFKDARGETVRTQFREAYEHGGLFLFDELDGSSPSAVVALNAALANGVCPFPDGTISRHPDFKCIAAGNTTLGGASRQYTGRTQLDAASIDRFAFIEFGYDETLERALATDAAWCRYVQAARKAVTERGLTHLVTPRATLDGCKLLASSFDREEVAQMVVWKGLDAETVQQLQRAIRVPLQPAGTQAA